MNGVTDLFDAEDAATVAEVLTGVVMDPTSSREIVYHCQGIPGLAPRLGVASTPSVSRTVRAWRGAPQQRADQPIETGTRQYIVLVADLNTPTAITPAEGDYITDDDGKWGVTAIENGEIGPGNVYYLLSTQLRRGA